MATTSGHEVLLLPYLTPPPLRSPLPGQQLQEPHAVGPSRSVEHEGDEVAAAYTHPVQGIESQILSFPARPPGVLQHGDRFQGRAAATQTQPNRYPKLH